MIMRDTFCNCDLCAIFPYTNPKQYAFKILCQYEIPNMLLY